MYLYLDSCIWFKFINKYSSLEEINGVFIKSIVPYSSAHIGI